MTSKTCSSAVPRLRRPRATLPNRCRSRRLAFLAIDTEPDYPDTAAGASALWKYKAIYRLADEQVGQWSDVISTTVAG